MLLIAYDNINRIPVPLINMLRYIWETEFAEQEVMFSLEVSGDDKQGITSYIGEQLIKMRVIPSDEPVKAKVFFRKYMDGWLISLQ